MTYVSFSPYELLPNREDEGAGFQSMRNGFLIRLQNTEEGWTGYADCHSWPELGDPSLTELMHSFAKAQEAHCIVKAALWWAQFDGKARQRGVALLQEALPLRSHWLCVNLYKLTSDKLCDLRQKGFSYIKVKIGQDVINEEKQLSTLIQQNSDLKWRLDCNCKLKNYEAEELFKKLSPHRDVIDFVEDPTAYDPLLWHDLQKRHGIAIANDNASPLEVAVADGFSVIIVKPALTTGAALRGYKNYPLRWVFTSYLGHPFGQMAAWHMASQWYVDNGIEPEICGLSSHRIYQPTVFSEKLGNAPYLSQPDGYGLGYENLLVKQKWRETMPVALGQLLAKQPLC